MPVIGALGYTCDLDEVEIAWAGEQGNLISAERLGLSASWTGGVGANASSN
mgnify:CR=1 FL=1